MSRLGILAMALALCSTPVLADETIVHHDGDAAPPASSTTVEKHDSGDGCASKTVHKENDEGDSKTVHKSNCD